jgi:hypothetical protein
MRDLAVCLLYDEALHAAPAQIASKTEPHRTSAYDQDRS